MSGELTPSARRVQDFLETLGMARSVREFPQTTRSAADAARAIGCRVEQIAKSLVFRGKYTKKPVLVITSGANRVNEEKAAGFAGEPLEKADAAFVREKTGFAIGGVPPVGHHEQLLTFIDEDLLREEEIWAAAGTPNAVFPLTPAELVKITGGRIVTIK
ncbi:MAG: YbaK/EbsC family protein [Desulfotomaculales bacterium]